MSTSPANAAIPPLIPVSRVRERLLAAYPAYAAPLTDAEWEAITERLEALARLLWEFSQDEARRAGDGKQMKAALPTRRKIHAGNEGAARSRSSAQKR